jgi:hypothetical protein
MKKTIVMLFASAALMLAADQTLDAKAKTIQVSSIVAVK